MYRPVRFLMCLLLVLPPAAGLHAKALEKNLDRLLEGVKAICAPGVPGPLCVFGERAFVVVAGGVHGNHRAPVVAAGILGKGRVVAFGHGGYFEASALAAADTGRLMKNAVLWAGGKPGDKVRIAVRGLGGLKGFLQEQGLIAEALSQNDRTERFGDCDVLCLDPTSLVEGREFEAIDRFVREGGGLVAAGLGWGWLQLNRGKSLKTDHPGNRLFAPAGILWADGTLERTGKAGFTVSTSDLEFAHAGFALDALVRHENGHKKLDATDLSRAAWTVTHAARSLPPQDRILLPRFEQLRRKYADRAVPTPEKPLTTAHPLDRLMLTLAIDELKGLPPEKRLAHPAADRFPGKVSKSAGRITRSFQIDIGVPGWHSTGLYVAPGEVLEILLPAEAPDKGLWVRIGSHSDALWHHGEWKRCPVITRRDRLLGPSTRTACAFGGLIYIEVPDGAGPGSIPVEIRGGVEAPHFIRGKTGIEDWRKSIRKRAAPWAELETDKVVLTLPSDEVRDLEDPERVLEFWDRVLDGCAELAGRPLERARPERYVADVQISAGYMHSGYPIMTHLDIAPVMVDVDRMIANGHGGVWGLFHEMGHNHQSGDWTFSGTVEVTCNLFTLFVFEKVCGMPVKSFGSFEEEAMQKSIKTHLEAGAPFDVWKRSPFLALIMYIQLKEAFGWEPYKALFTEYLSLPAPARPGNDDEKRDQWMVRFSSAVGRNLGPFFQAWGVPTSGEARASIAGLPLWLPEDFPPE